MLEARDQVMEHQFNFNISLTGLNQLKEGEDVLESKLYKNLKLKIKQFLAEAIGNVVSAGFNFLCKTDL